MDSHASRRRVIVVAIVVSLFAALAVAGIAYDRSRSAVDVSSYERVPAPRNQPDAYYDSPWIYFVGDSYTEGTSFDSGRGAIWTDLVAEQRGWYARNVGVGGSGYATNGRTGAAYTGQIEKSALTGANGVVVSGGINDIRGTADSNQIAERVSQTLSRIRQLQPDVPLTVLSVFDPYGTPNPKLSAMNDALRSESVRFGAKFVEVSDLFDGRPNLIAPDGLHPTDAGHAAIAAAVGPQIAEPTPRTDGT